jgi:predicted TIM-barrel fold metal-dependent hydrolase
MEDFEIVDAHVHLFRDLKREQQGFRIPGRRDRDRWGNADAIGPFMDREGVSNVVVLSFYPTGVMRRSLRSKVPADASAAEREQAYKEIEQQLATGLRRQNEWTCKLGQDDSRIIAGIGVQKLLSPQEMVQEVELRASQGAHAVKMVPGWFHEFPGDRAFWPVYRRCVELGLPVTADTGTLGLGRHAAHPDEDNKIAYGEPVHFTEVLESFPGLTVVMAHFACAFWDERVEMAMRFPNLMFDISGGFQGPGVEARNGHRAIAEEDAVRVIRHVGVERFMFGTDGPHHMLQPVLEQFLRLDFTDDEKRRILSQNARRIYRF